MKQFNRHKTFAEILAQCIASGIQLDATQYDRGGDHIEVVLPGRDGELLPILFNTASGRFFCSHDDESKYFCSSLPLDGEPWFDAIMAFFFTDAELDSTAPAAIPVTLQLPLEVVCDLLTVAANCRQADKECEGHTTHGQLDVVRLLTMLAEDAAMTNSRPGSWEGANMQDVLDAHGYH